MCKPKARVNRWPRLKTLHFPSHTRPPWLYRRLASLLSAGPQWRRDGARSVRWRAPWRRARAHAAARRTPGPMARARRLVSEPCHTRDGLRGASSRVDEAEAMYWAERTGAFQQSQLQDFHDMIRLCVCALPARAGACKPGPRPRGAPPVPPGRCAGTVQWCGAHVCVRNRAGLLCQRSCCAPHSETPPARQDTRRFSAGQPHRGRQDARLGRLWQHREGFLPRL